MTSRLFPEPQQLAFSIESDTVRPYASDDDVQVAITFELSPDLSVITNASHSSIFGWLAEIGGLSVAIFLLLKVMVLIVTSGAMENHLVSHLYTQMGRREFDQRKFNESNEENGITISGKSKFSFIS